MAFTFGQHIMLQDTSLYANSLVNETNIPFSNNTYEENLTMTNNTYFIKLFIQPMLGKQTTIKIKLIDENNNERLFANFIIDSAERYVTELYNLNVTMKRISTMISDGGSLKNLYDSYKKAVDEQENIVAAKKAIIDNPETRTSQALIEYETALKSLNEKKELLENTAKELANEYQKLLTLRQTYSSYLSNIKVPWSQSLLVPSNITYQKIIITYSIESIIEDDEIDLKTTNLILDLNILKINEILGNEQLIPNQLLKRFAIQGAANTHFFINNRETIIGTNQIFELAIPQIKIYSLKVVPDGHPFIIDYEYQEE